MTANTTAASSGPRETGTVLDRIVADRRLRLAEDQRAAPLAVLAGLAASRPPPIDFAARLVEGRAASPEGARLRLIAEIKRASPSRGVIDGGLDADAQAREYAAAGASAVSVLTEPTFFQGSIDDLAAAAAAFGGDADRPALLRKDFVFDAYQVIEARAHGADALLLIAMLLPPTALSSLLELTHAQGMEALVEVHDAAELAAAVGAGARVIGGQQPRSADLRRGPRDLRAARAARAGRRHARRRVRDPHGRGRRTDGRGRRARRARWRGARPLRRCRLEGP